MATPKLYKVLSDAKNEKDVENGYRQVISENLGLPFTSPFNCDGVVESKEHELKMLIEIKFDDKFKDENCNLVPLAQAIFYLKKFQDAQELLPTVVFIGDKDECFVVSTAILLPYLSKKYDWSLPPSSAYKDIQLMIDLKQDTAIHPEILKIDKKFSYDILLSHVIRCNKQINANYQITKDSIVDAFEFWNKNVIDNSASKNGEVINSFMTAVCTPGKCYLHPKKRNVLVVKDKEIKVNGKMFLAFFSKYKENHNPIEIREITANKDRLVTEMKRRRTGEFFTPSDWVDESQKMITEQLGEDWRDKYVVWDASAGTCNLTRNYKFKELYSSTLEQADIDISNETGYNPEATKFQFDFLNDGLDKLPDGLKKALEQNKPIVFYNNPPYGTANDAGAKGTNKKGIANNTLINSAMKEDNIGPSSQQLYAQYLYRMSQLLDKYNLSDAFIATFTKMTFMTGETLKGLRGLLFNKMHWVGGMTFQASHFADVSSTWGILFSMLKNGKKQTKYICEVKGYDDLCRIVNINYKELYSLDSGKKASEWVREPIKQCDTYDAPQLINALNYAQSGRGKLCKNAFGYFLSNANSTADNATSVCLFSGTVAKANGLSILEENVNRVVALFSARRLILSDWTNFDDQYMSPDESQSDYQQWVNDAIVYSILHTASHQSSLRGITYKGEKWDILNHFFFMSNSNMKELSVTHNFTELYNDAIAFGPDRYVYNELESRKLSPDAREVLEFARKLVRKSFAKRANCHIMDEKYHLNAWDAGWYQIKNGILKEHYKDEYQEFVILYKKFEERMRDGVYKFGFLKK